ncbi:NADPH:quinone reductase [Nakamurella leprariae]|uniref:NADPH:quinone reductase n=1 Tax=Nakamurella leprariae TaxID=2803911 RepID=A0A938YIH2_9ACTN|nr:NADPH:quinone reductase [Nakamurella leprariae]MBM9468395.1 NADPH:quinone reductase [Nakamurella leprariae]
MRAIVYTRTGDPDVLTLIDKPETPPGPGEVQVRIHRSGVNPTDWKTRRGGVGGTSGGTVDPPQVPGQDGAGVVEAVGAGVSPDWIGRRVWVWEAAAGRPEGTLQELALVPETQVVPLPDSASFDLGAALPIPFVTAHRCLTLDENGPQVIGPGALQGRTVLVAGGAGAVGNAAIQLARWADATVIATVSGPEKAQLAVAAGADHVVDYRRQDVVAEVRKLAPHGVNTVVEVSVSQNAAIDAAVLAPHGVVAIYAGNADDQVTLPVRSSMVQNARWQFVLLYTEPHGAKVRAVRDLTAALEAGAVRVGQDAGVPLHHFDLADAAAAHQAVEDGAVGKVLVDVLP